MAEPLQEAFFETERARLQRWFPWVHLFRAFRLATRWQNLAIALLGLLLLSAGRWGISYLPFSAYSLNGNFSQQDVNRSRLGNQGLPVTAEWSWFRDQPPGVQVEQVRTRWPWEQQFLSPMLPAVSSPIQTPAPGTLLAPLKDVVQPGMKLFNRASSWSTIADAWLQMLLALAVGSLAGGAITRRVASEFAISQEPAFRDSIRDTWRGLPHTFGAPLLSFVGVGMLFLCGRTLAWIGLIPGLGEPILGAMWGLLLIVSLVMALILLGVAIAWPLMVASHSCEGTDSFDALNRAYNYVFVRPWYGLWLLTVSLVYGMVVVGFVIFLTQVTVNLGDWMVAGPLSDEALGRLTHKAPALVDNKSIASPTQPTVGTEISALWQRGLASLLTAFVYSYFWTAATLIYLLLRKSTDATDLTEIYQPRTPAPPGPPLVGVAAVNRREAEEAASTPASPGDAAAPPAEQAPPSEQAAPSEAGQ